MKSEGQEITREGRCFSEINIRYDVNKNSDGIVDSVKFTFKTSGKKSLLCVDWFFIATREVYHVETFFWEKTSEITFKGFDSGISEDILFNGFDVYLFCEGFIDTFISVYKTILMFAGDIEATHSPGPHHVPKYMADANLNFIKEAMGIVMEERETNLVEFDPSYINSGDFILILRLDGTAPMIMYGTGAHASHCAMALRFDGELYIVESQGASYWPNAGFQRTKWADWV